MEAPLVRVAFQGRRGSIGLGAGGLRQARGRSIEADGRAAVAAQELGTCTGAAAEVEDVIRSSEGGALNGSCREFKSARPQRFAVVVTAALVGMIERALHHLSSKACSTWSILPRAKASGT